MNPTGSPTPDDHAAYVPNEADTAFVAGRASRYCVTSRATGWVRMYYAPQTPRWDLDCHETAVRRGMGWRKRA